MLMVTIPAGAILFAAVVAWTSVVILGIAAWRVPRVGALVERTVLGAAAAVLVTVYGIVALNTDLGLPWFDSITSKAVIRGAVLLLGLLPVYWLALYLTGNLGE